MDEIARKRIDAACNEKYTVKELVDFDLELLFFYKEYFELDAAKETKKYVYQTMFSLLCTKGDLFLEHNQIIGADDIYAAALKYSMSSSERELISTKRAKIASAVNSAREVRAREQAINQLKREQERAKERRRKRIEDIFVKIIAIAALVCIPLVVVFGLLLLLGIAKDLSSVILLISFGILVVIGFACAIDAIYRKLNK